MCISKGAFPDSFKVAQVIPLFKGGDRKDPNCYSPISLLPALGMLLEKIVSVRALDYLLAYCSNLECMSCERLCCGEGLGLSTPDESPCSSTVSTGK